MDTCRSSPPQAPHIGQGSDTQHQSLANQPNSSANQGQACQRCRQQKLRCSRESPSCARCQRASAVCTYPPPPDRKLLAAQRVRKSRFRPYQEPRSSTVPSMQAGVTNRLLSSTPERILPSAEDRASDGIPAFGSLPVDGSQRHTPRGSASSPQTLQIAASVVSRPTLLPSSEVARLLIEMYFTRVYNAALLFHKETFLSDYAANKVPNFIAYAVFALASIFLPTPSKGSRIEDHETELKISALTASNFSDHAQQWAIVATRQVLMQGIELNVQNFQACQVLALYWFSKDIRDRAHILTHLAYMSCRLLGFHDPKVEAVDGDELLAEVKRRCFWSCWMTACISPENAPFKNESWGEVVGLPFPADEASFAAGKPESTEAFNNAGKVIPYKGWNKARQTSIMGELVKLFALWWQIQQFVRRYQDGHSHGTSDRLREFLKLDRCLEEISDNLHPDFKYSSPASFNSPKLDPYALFSIQSLYRLCACALHSSLVPLFSSKPPDPEISKKLVRMCAEETVKQSAITLDMATAFLSIRPDKSRLSSMTGFAMFVSSAIQIRSLGAQRKLNTHAGYLKAAVSILKDLNQYWTPLRSLWTKLWVVSSIAGLDINSFAVTNNDPELDLAGIQTDIEQIISPRAVSGSDQGGDLYPHVERRVRSVLSQQLLPADDERQNATGKTLASLMDGNNTIVGSQISQGREATMIQANVRQLGSREATIVADSPSFAPVYPQAHDATTISQTTSLEQGDAFRPTMNGLNTMTSIMGISKDLDNDDDWWNQSWGLVKIL